jgi:hypothetical protein
MMRRTLAVAFALAAAAGCSSSTQGSGAGPRSSSNTLTRQELSTVSVDNTYEAVQRLRPNLLRARTTSAPGANQYPIVYVDGIRKGSIEYLRSIPRTEVQEIRYLNVQDATTRYGMDVPAGVLDVKLIGR